MLEQIIRSVPPALIASTTVTESDWDTGRPVLRSLLSTALSMNYTEGVKALVNALADVNSYMSAKAVIKGDFEIVSGLIELGHFEGPNHRLSSLRLYSGTSGFAAVAH
uniref:Uncharacterized protein n=1 Tax=Chromera velia CCMP2878 TaxID=1169474 RepID=A0A0G4HSE6_9ALVE|eukprot:Cvel_31031.t1-p1 / transcript=Cvel_31031.t1 / gene=Cvel_31031 / organism=Chromera_velia_CCMP2878 / gene_product=hypothetical protein / transcript_product=hypothetical protein / location=Cvel_scaffold4543:34-2243(-) / protein_length=107 / sequence_SO=supercontig / SO=protein_coding / is_pseudo=false